MSLRSKLSSEVIEELATLMHNGTCAQQNEDMDEGDDEECIAEDMEVVKEMLDILDREGVELNRMWIPLRMKGE